MYHFPTGSHGLRHGGADSSHPVSHSELHETHFRPSAEIETKMEIKTYIYEGFVVKLHISFALHKLILEVGELCYRFAHLC